jgi:hypothetical protein
VGGVELVAHVFLYLVDNDERRVSCGVVIVER